MGEVGKLLGISFIPSRKAGRIPKAHLSASTVPSLEGTWVSGRFVSLETGVALHLMYVHLGKGHRIKNPDLR